MFSFLSRYFRRLFFSIYKEHIQTKSINGMDRYLSMLQCLWAITDAEKVLLTKHTYNVFESYNSLLFLIVT